MHDDHAQILRKTPQVHGYLIDYFQLTVGPSGSQYADPVNLLSHQGLGQADVVLALLRGQDPLLHRAAEALVGRPIYKLPPQTVRELPKTPAPPEVPPADRRVILEVAPNPRLPTTPAFQRYRLFRRGSTVAQVLMRGVTRKDLREATRGGWIRLSELAP